MNNDQATEIAKRIINTMRPTPGLVEWVEVLEPLDFDQALVTFRTLRDETDNGLSIARFLHAHRARNDARLHTKTHRARTAPTPDCPHCDGAGVEPGPSIHETIGGEPHEYTTLMPCRCTRPATTLTVPAPANLFDEEF